MPGRVLIVAPQIEPESLRWRSIADGARAEGLEAEWLAPVASENALRARLAAGDVRLIVLIGHGESRGADHATIGFSSSAGPETRAVNLRHLAALFAAAPRLEGVVLVPRDGDGSPRGALRLCRAAGRERRTGDDAVGRCGRPRAQSRVVRGLARRRGVDALARLGGTLLEHAGELPAAVIRIRPRRRQPRRLQRDRPRRRPRQQRAQASPAPAPVPPSPPAPPSREAIVERLLESKRADGRFDVFLCHNSADKPAVKAVARALRSRGVLPWLDEWELPPGQPWQPLLEQQIGQIRSAAVFVGLAGVGPWQEQEIYGFLREFVARRSAVIPVLLDNAPSAPDLPIFLRAMTYVDFRLREPDPMVRLEWGITGVRPDYA